LPNYPRRNGIETRAKYSLIVRETPRDSSSRFRTIVSVRNNGPTIEAEVAVEDVDSPGSLGEETFSQKRQSERSERVFHREARLRRAG
jgi:hypothetical protein